MILAHESGNFLYYFTSALFGCMELVNNVQLISWMPDMLFVHLSCMSFFIVFFFFASINSDKSKLLCSFMQQSEQEQDEPSLCESPFDELSSGHIGMLLPVNFAV